MIKAESNAGSYRELKIKAEKIKMSIIEFEINYWAQACLALHGKNI